MPVQYINTNIQRNTLFVSSTVCRRLNAFDIWLLIVNLCLCRWTGVKVTKQVVNSAGNFLKVYRSYWRWRTNSIHPNSSDHTTWTLRVSLCLNSHLESSRSQIICKPNQSQHNNKLKQRGLSHKKGCSFPLSRSVFSCFRFSCLLPHGWDWMIMSHIAHTSPLMEVWGLITAQNSVWFGEGGCAGGGRLDASRISESAGVRCDSSKCCVSLHSASHAVRWWAGWSPSCLRDFGAPTNHWLFISITKHKSLCYSCALVVSACTHVDVFMWAIWDSRF